MSTTLANHSSSPMSPLPQMPPTSKGFLAHIIACVVGAGIDNLFRQVALVVMTFVAMSSFPDDLAEAERMKGTYDSWALMLFNAPFILLAPLAGSLGDRIGKHHIIRVVRLADIPIIALGVWGYATNSIFLVYACLLLLAINSAFFSPVKLAVIPELVPQQKLAKANAFIAAATVVSILGGTILAVCTDVTQINNLFSHFGLTASRDTTVYLLAAIAGVISIVGAIAAFRIPALPAQSPQTPIAMPWAVVRQVKSLSNNPGTWTPALTLAGFWALGGATFAGLSSLATMVYGLQQTGVVGCFLALAIGMVIGSVLAPLLMARTFPAGAPLFGVLLAGSAFTMVGITALYDLGLPLAERSADGIMFWLVITGIGAGIWEVPVTVLLQERTKAEQRNIVMSAVSVLGSFGMFAAAGIFALLLSLGLTTTQTFIALGGFTLLCGLWALNHFRKQFAGWLITLFVRSSYRVHVHSSEHFPQQGGCLVVCNHLSYSDGIILASHLPRPGRFLVYRRYVDVPIIGLFLRAAGVIPVAAEDSRRALLASIDAAVEAAKAGEVVVIFPEGKLTRSGQMDVFRSGLERIAGRAGVPIVPAHLDGLWGTITSRARHYVSPRFLRPVHLRLGSPLPPTATAAEARAAVMALSYETAQQRSDNDHRTLASAALASMRKHPLRTAVEDAQGKLTYWQLIAVARLLAKRLALNNDEKCVGVLLPPGRAGAIANVALALLGRTAVNLNHTVGTAQLARMCELAQIKTIISASLYLRRINNPELPGRACLIEELLGSISKLSIMITAIGSYIKPNAWITQSKPTDIAAIIFSSGSTGDPKGVELTHRQVLANIQAVKEGLELDANRDVLLSPLPLFHSFGLVPGFWLGIVLGMPTAAQPDPTDANALGSLAQKTGATFMLSTPTFVRGYLRRVEPEQFKTLRFAVVGAERCPADLKQQFKDRYGASLLEGYGCTELAPVIAVNLLTIKRDGVEEIRQRDGSVGRPLPGIDVFTIHPDTHERLPVGSEGLLIVRSASRMRGYLNRDDLTKKAFVHGGYNTGDMGRVDADGFIHITGRLARFAKIGGEMVPLDNIEIAVHQAVLRIVGPESAIEIAVTAVTDSARGERLLVLHTGFTGNWDELLTTLEHLPALWRPKARDIYQVQAIPKLGTGKRDLAGLKNVAAQLGV
jgi:acyl-[acyl-carrier-protein]-phospholipid O-acyltransferase / long-chain-fatty-acid--[acyl-carrier-protein] ligase